MKGLVEIKYINTDIRVPLIFGTYVFRADDVFDERTFPQRTQRSVK